jgi:hypothetical protein
LGSTEEFLDDVERAVDNGINAYEVDDSSTLKYVSNEVCEVVRMLVDDSMGLASTVWDRS